MNIFFRLEYAEQVDCHLASQWLEGTPSKAAENVCTAATLQAAKHAYTLCEMLAGPTWPEPPGSKSSEQLWGCADELQNVWDAKVTSAPQCAYEALLHLCRLHLAFTQHRQRKCWLRLQKL